jgi:hypothetical protein
MIASTRQEQVEGVRGERTTALAAAGHSLQSRLSSILAAGLMLALGLAALTWYYARTLTHTGSTRGTAQPPALTRAQGEMTLPSLGPISPPQTPASNAGPAIAPLAPTPDLALERSQISTLPSRGGLPAQQPQESSHEVALERRLSGVVFAGTPSETAAPEKSPPAIASAQGRPQRWTHAQRMAATTPSQPSCDRASHPVRKRAYCRHSGSCCRKARSSIARSRRRSIPRFPE